jgi:eukaryotic-like serine/threonine-protein kinase
MADQVGRVLGGRYRLVAPIGTGASAHVFVAHDVTLKRKVAVKVLHAALAEDESFLRRFRAEAEQAGNLTHPNIMRVFDWGESGDGPFLVLEHLAGGSLRDMLDEGTRLTPSQALLVGLEAARALDYAHRRGLVHRDIKPANLLFDDEGRVCIADFGLARALAEAAWTEPVGTVLGTARYAAPEQVQGASVDGRADVYALALVMVEAVTGRVPFAADTTIATLMGRVGARLEAPEELGPIGPVVQQAAAPEAADRLDAGGLARALEDVARRLPAPDPFRLAPRSPRVDLDERGDVPGDLTELGTGAPRPAAPPIRVADEAPTAALPVTASPASAPEADGAPFVLPAARRRRRRWPWVALLLGLAAFGAGTAYAFVQLRIPEHPIPNLAGKTLEEARAEVADEKFKLRVSSSRNDDVVPENRVIVQDPALGELREGQTIELVLSLGPPARTVPDLTGLDQAAAEEAVRAQDLVPTVARSRNEDVPAGTVIDWSPVGETTKGAQVTVNVSDGPPLREVPELAGRSFEDARAVLAQQGLVAKRSDAFSNDVEPGVVIRTQPGPGAPAEKGAAITVVVSKGPNTVAVPQIVGRTVEEATSLLQEAGLTVEAVVPRQGRRVLASDPAPGATVPRGSGVTLFAP